MSATPNEPHAWVILGGLRDMVQAPFALHETNEFPAILEAWKASRVSEWPQELTDRFFSFSWSKTKVSVGGNETAVDGFVLFGTTPLDENKSIGELSTLAALIAVKFGQPMIELHICGRRLTLQRNEGGQSN